MPHPSIHLQYLLSLPPVMVEGFSTVAGKSGPEWFVAADPERGYLGSGGATAHLLAEAWRGTGDGRSFREWLNQSRKIILHGGGQSRRLPAYAPVGKPFLPVPIDRHSYGQAIDQSLIDVQLPLIEQAVSSAPAGYCVAIASGNVYLQFAPIGDDLPEANVLIFGMRADAEMAKDFGVIMMGEAKDEIAFFLQKPSAAEIDRHAETHPFLVDTGLWLLSEQAVLLLMENCGWIESEGRFANGAPNEYELYAKFGTCLGTRPRVQSPAFASLTSRARSLERPEFYHLGTSRQLIESFTQIQNRGSGGPALRSARVHPERFVLNSSVDCWLEGPEHHTIWLEIRRSRRPGSSRRASDHRRPG